MPEGTRVHNCVEKVKVKGGANPYAVCQKATGQSFATGRKLKEERRRSDGSIKPRPARPD